jgi:hypothetical protein
MARKRLTPIHPGEILLHEFLEPLEPSQGISFTGKSPGRRRAGPLQWIAASAALLGACSSSEPSARLMDIRTQNEQYPPGDSVQITFTNTSANPLSVNTCSGWLQKLVLGRWVAVAPSAAACKDYLLPLSPRQSVQQVLPLTSELTAGSYRYLFDGLLSDALVLLPLQDRVSNAFRVD